MERGAFVCPFCGALYKGSIPADAVQVKCDYCGGIIIVPLEGRVPRCPNHPDSFAIGLCNDCSRSFCERCLYILTVGYGVNIYVCPSCLKKRPVRFQTPITIYKRREGAKIEMLSPPTAEDIYKRLLDVYIQIYGSMSGKAYLEKKIKFYLERGFHREGAIRQVSADEGI